MAAATTPSPVSVVLDASVVIALCAKEPDKVVNAEAKVKEYATNGCVFYAPGVLIAECLYVLCKKLATGKLTSAEHASAVTNLITLLAHIQPPPAGDKMLVKRAEELRGALACPRSADGVYLALAEELHKSAATEVVTFDAAMKAQATANSLGPPVVVIATI